MASDLEVRIGKSFTTSGPRCALSGTPTKGLYSDYVCELYSQLGDKIFIRNRHGNDFIFCDVIPFGILYEKEVKVRATNGMITAGTSTVLKANTDLQT